MDAADDGMERGAQESVQRTVVDRANARGRAARAVAAAQRKRIAIALHCVPLSLRYRSV